MFASLVANTCVAVAGAGRCTAICVGVLVKALLLRKQRQAPAPGLPSRRAGRCPIVRLALRRGRREFRRSTSGECADQFLGCQDCVSERRAVELMG